MSITIEQLDNIINKVNVLKLEVFKKDITDNLITIKFGKKDFDVFVVRCNLIELRKLNYITGVDVNKIVTEPTENDIVNKLTKDYLKMSELFFNYDLEMYRIKRKHEINKNYCINILTDNLNEIKNGFRKPVKIEPVEFKPDVDDISFSVIEEDIYKDEDLIAKLEKCLEILKGDNNE